MKKIIQRTGRFEKSFGKLKGKRKDEYAFSVTDDIRAIYEKHSQKGKEILIFKFVDIGGHSKVY